jgi:hypothetical protein
MRKALLPAILYTAFAAGAIGSCLWGRAGLRAYRELEVDKAAVQANTKELEARNQALSLVLERLRTDSSAVDLLVRDMGYLEESEHRVILPSYRPPVVALQVGHVLPSKQLAPNPRQGTLYLLPLVLFLVAYVAISSRRRDDG